MKWLIVVRRVALMLAAVAAAILGVPAGIELLEDAGPPDVEPVALALEQSELSLSNPPLR